MRIISGTAGSLSLKVPKLLTRPTTDRVREAIFSSLAHRLPDARVLDLYAGSGSLGIESLSRGATSATFIESHGEACRVIQENLDTAKLGGGNIVRVATHSFLSRNPWERFDLIFADPPYARDEATEEELAKLLESEVLPAICAADGLLVLETLATSPLPETALWTVEKEKKYGKTRVSFLSPAPPSP